LNHAICFRSNLEVFAVPWDSSPWKFAAAQMLQAVVPTRTVTSTAFGAAACAEKKSVTVVEQFELNSTTFRTFIHAQPYFKLHLDSVADLRIPPSEADHRAADGQQRGRRVASTALCSRRSVWGFLAMTVPVSLPA
jgi:hypothetical protein